MKARKFIPLFLFLIFLLGSIASNVKAEEEGFIWIISNNKLVKLKEHIVLDDEFYIIHSYNYISIRYYKGNETFFQRQKQVGKMLKLALHDGATLEIKHNNSIILKAITHKRTIGNVFKYGLGIEFQKVVISILMAFICAIAVNVAYFYNLERRIL